ncbi:MAG: hypothetical protein J6M62_11450 [Selenomonadaceae bacterium]|nr:hypothetical protein [Selenomonadaceae bacterium]MBP3721892.1 hypothetical protein [Selenomonadaceae bacterium]
MTALREEVHSFVNLVPEENLRLVLEFVEKVCKDKNNSIEPWKNKNPDSSPLEYLAGLLEGTPPITAKEIRRERLKAKYGV